MEKMEVRALHLQIRTLALNLVMQLFSFFINDF